MTLSQSTGRRSFLVLIHRVFVGGVTKKGGADHVIDYYIGKELSSTLIEHPLVDFSQATKVSVNGQVARTWTLNVPGPIRWLAETIYNLWFVLRTGQKFDFILAVDPLSFISAYLIKKFGRAKKVLFHSIDFSERRFSSLILNSYYLFLYRFAARRADLVTYVSLAMGEKIKEFLGAAAVLDPGSGVRSQGKIRDLWERLFYLPNSPDYDKVPKVEPSKKNRASLVYTKARISRTEVERLVKMTRTLVHRFPDLQITLIGQVEADGVDIINNIEAKDCFKLVGVIAYQKNLELVSQASVGLAWYEGDLSFEKYADSLKLREYAAAGLPSVCNQGISTAFEMEREGAGILVRSDAELVTAIEKLLTDEAFYLSIRQKALAWAQRLDKTLLLSDLAARLTNTS